MFTPLGLRLEGEPRDPAQAAKLSPPLLHIMLITLPLFAVVVVAGVRLSSVLTSQLQQLEAFSRRL